MKKNAHPPYQEVVFEDSSTGHRFVCGSTLNPKEKITFNGKEYPLYRLSVSSYSHPFFTGSKQLVDSEGRVDKFKKRYMTTPAVQSAGKAAPATTGATKPTAAKKSERKK